MHNTRLGRDGGGRDYSPRGKDERRDRDREYSRRDRGESRRSRSPDDGGMRDRDMKDVRDREDDKEEPLGAGGEEEEDGRNGNEGAEPDAKGL